MRGDVVPAAVTQVTPYQPPPARDERTLLAGFLAGYKGRTRETYSADLLQWAGWLTHDVGVQLLGATRAHAQVYARMLDEAGRAPATVARKLSAIASFYNYCVLEEALERSPLAHVRRPKVSDDSPRLGLDRHELARLLATAETAGLVEHALVCLLALNGLRVSEACGAGREDLDEERGHRVLDVRRKGGKHARVPLAPRTSAAIAALISAPSADEAGVDEEAPASLLLGIDRFEAWRRIRKLAHAAGITKKISPHSLRHTFVTLALDAGVELRDVQDAAGHADPRTTRRYDRGRHSLDRHATYRVAAFIDVDEPAP